MVHDPVCGMEIKDISNAEIVEHEGKKYYLCSTMCKNKFLAGPEDYIKNNDDENHSMHEHHHHH
ncbi:hypothetical protein MNBD_IGNAVI01-2659 [hydrothermal vent metagenome]|uniref:TRASH domain-containing protein n=1 Tax=hydrothermal vent metagenome TaxID=652676 RepID=A0A3B1BKU7_9ZZZZ